MKVIALVGCPNVGKSTLFNRLTKTRDALVADFPGLTRDRKYGRAVFDGREYIVVDTGGISDDKEQSQDLTSRMTAQALAAINESDLVLFLVDARAGLLPGDYQAAEYIRRSGKPCAVVANKIDGLDPDIAGTEFYSLGLGEVHQIAAAHGRGVTSLVEDVIAPVLREEGPLDSDPLPDEKDSFDYKNFTVDVSALYDDVELRDHDLNDYPEADEDNTSDDRLREDMAEPDALSDGGGSEEEFLSAMQGSAAPLKKRGKKVRTDWEEGYDFLGSVPVEVKGGGFSYHGLKNTAKGGAGISSVREEDGIREKSSESCDDNLPVNEEQEHRKVQPFADLPIKFALAGKPNVGKSTLTNRLLGEDRVVVCDMPGTTRDSIYIPLERDGRKYIVVDTAGVRRRKKVTEAVEKFSIVKTLKAVEDANVVVLIIDAKEQLSDQDLSLLSFIIDSGRSLVIAVNKWDGLDLEYKKEIKKQLDLRLGFVDFARVHFISALYGTGVGNLFDSINEAYESAVTRHSSAVLNRILQSAVAEHEPPVSGGRRIKLKYAHAGGYNPPRIIIHGNKTGKLPDSYKRYLINCYRKSLKIMGTPILLEFKEGENPYADRKPAQKRLTQSQMRAERRQAQTKRMWEHAAKKKAAQKKKLLEKGAVSGMVLKKTGKKS